MDWTNVANGAAGFGRGYLGKGGQPPAPGGQQQPPAQGGWGAPLMKYLHRKQAYGHGSVPDSTSSTGQPSVNDDAPMPDMNTPPAAANPMPSLATTQPVQPSMPPPAMPPPAIPPQGPPQGDPQGQGAPPPAFAQGRVVSKPTTAILGEDGPEMVVPLSGRADAKVSPSNLRMQYNRRS